MSALKIKILTMNLQFLSKNSLYSVLYMALSERTVGTHLCKSIHKVHTYIIYIQLLLYK